MRCLPGVGVAEGATEDEDTTDTDDDVGVVDTEELADDIDVVETEELSAAGLVDSREAGLVARFSMSATTWPNLSSGNAAKYASKSSGFLRAVSSSVRSSTFLLAAATGASSWPFADKDIE